MGGPQNSSISIPWALVRNTHSWVPPRPTGSAALGMKPRNLCFHQALPPGFQCLLQFENHCSILYHLYKMTLKERKNSVSRSDPKDFLEKMYCKLNFRGWKNRSGCNRRWEKLNLLLPYNPAISLQMSWRFMSTQKLAHGYV